MNQELNKLLQELNEDADLLVRSDQWLEEQRVSISSLIDNLLQELNAIQKAINIKRKLQDKNLVAIQELDQLKGRLIIKIMKLKDGIQALAANKNDDIIDTANKKGIIAGIVNDGYDVMCHN